jgi:hypothetical protein
MLKDFDEYISEQSWNENFDVKFDIYLEKYASSNMRLFMGQSKDIDLMPVHSEKSKKRAQPVADEEMS